MSSGKPHRKTTTHDGRDLKKAPYGKKSRIYDMHTKDYIRLGCGCVARVLRPSDHDWTMKPYCITITEDCELRYAVGVPRPPRCADAEIEVWGGWKDGVPGGKVHYPGLTLYDCGDGYAIRLKKQDLLDKWKKDLDNDAESDRLATAGLPGDVR